MSVSSIIAFPRASASPRCPAPSCWPARPRRPGSVCAQASGPATTPSAHRGARPSGFTGTPLLKKEKNTLSTFGRLIHRYAIDKAVADGVPESIRGDEDAQAFFGVLEGQLKIKDDEPVAGDEAASIALEIIDIIKSHLIVDIWSNEVAQNNLRNAIDDYFFDVLRDERGVDLPVEVLDDLELKIMDLARARFAA